MDMDLGLDMDVVFQRHDLLVEVGKVEMAMERLGERAPGERGTLRPILEARLTRLRKELVQLHA